MYWKVLRQFYDDLPEGEYYHDLKTFSSHKNGFYAFSCYSPVSVDLSEWCSDNDFEWVCRSEAGGWRWLALKNNRPKHFRLAQVFGGDNENR